MNPLRWSFRVAFLLGFLICCALLGYAYYSEVRLHLTPCNLCILQRVAFIWMALWFLIGGLHTPRRGGRWVYAVLVLIGVVFGIGVAGRQLWLQSLPADQVPSCGAGFNLLWAQWSGHYIALSQFITRMLSGDGDCAKVTWKFLGLTMAGWTMIWYILLGIWALLPCSRRTRLGGTRPLRAMGE
ncbi:MAG TPA: disulfide bond formation protein B [Rhodanobacteraceae bacterium]